MWSYLCWLSANLAGFLWPTVSPYLIRYYGNQLLVWYRVASHNSSIHWPCFSELLRHSSRLIHSRLGMNSSRFSSSTSNISMSVFLMEASPAITRLPGASSRITVIPSRRPFSFIVPRPPLPPSAGARLCLSFSSSQASSDRGSVLSRLHLCRLLCRPLSLLVIVLYFRMLPDLFLMRHRRLIPSPYFLQTIFLPSPLIRIPLLSLNSLF